MWKTPSEIKVSTITVISSLEHNDKNIKFNFDPADLYLNIELSPSIPKVKYLTNIRSIIIEPEKPEKKKRTRKSKDEPMDINVKHKVQKKIFPNQLTVVININKDINMKVFTNGKLQLTGCKSIDDATKTIEKFINVLETHSTKFKSLSNIMKPNTIKYTEPKIQNINAYYNIQNTLNLNELYNYLLIDFKKKDTDLFCVSLEPTTYPGINLKYIYDKDDVNKILTAFIFTTGRVMLTGINDMKQIDVLVDYINDIVKKNMKKVLVNLEN
jgi:TATA-box binding protein (TBP) (component of TFIID and TFIIIB)